MIEPEDLLAGVEYEIEISDCGVGALITDTFSHREYRIDGSLEALAFHHIKLMNWDHGIYIERATNHVPDQDDLPAET